jgi:serine phosphatase RsbU (regulator of sigma subunit)
MGREQPLRLGIGVVATGLFAVSYAFAGVSLRGKFWIAFFPLMALQLFVMTLSSTWFPDPPRPVQPLFSEMEQMQRRLTFDAFSIIAAVALGYAGFVVVFVREGRRHIRAHTEKAILDAEMAAAREVQLVMLPGTGESFPGYAVESLYCPAQEVGGDFFQIVPVGNSGLLIVLGDVAGKGLPAAMLVSMLVGSIRILAEDTHDPILILRKLHDRLMGRTRGGFSTALAAFIADDGQVTIANAGHLSPYLDGREIELQGALPLGIESSAHYESSSFELKPGSRLTFISDGVVEAQNKTGELFGFGRAEAMSQESAAEIVKAAVEFGQSDDITVVTIERLATNQVSSAA